MKRKSIELAIDNIINFGDTDIFPYPIDNFIFRDKRNELIKLIEDFNKNHPTNKDLKEYLEENLPQNISTCSPIGYNGFRWATQLDPFWNLFFLASVIDIAEPLEKARVASTHKIVHSYRYKPDFDKGSLFDTDYGWITFQNISLDLAKEASTEFVIICDIADFYTRIYHHRLENALQSAYSNNDDIKKILHILDKISNGTSYGLPIGCPASRILAEQTIDRVDKLLLSKGIKYVRFVDDYHLFAKNLEEAHSILSYLSITLMSNEGLSLQKHKTQIITKAEFSQLIKNRISDESDDPKTKERAKFMSLPIKYDPYSPSAEEDYEAIKESLKEFNIIDLLNQELQKSKIHQHFSKHLLRALNHADDNTISEAFLSICTRYNLLYPIFSKIMISAFHNYSRLTEISKSVLDDSLVKLFEEKSHIVQIELNVAYILRIIGLEKTDNKEKLIHSILERWKDSALIKSIIIQIMIKWKLDYAISNLKNQFPTFSKWERRMFIIGSYALKDEGEHWRKKHKKNFSQLEILIRDWASDKIQIKDWSMPL